MQVHDKDNLGNEHHLVFQEAALLEGLQTDTLAGPEDLRENG
jgi:hypothetical protein